MNTTYKELLQTKTLTDFYNVRFGKDFENEMERSDMFITHYEYDLNKIVNNKLTFGFDYLIVNHQFDFDFQTYKIVSFDDLLIFNHVISLGLFVENPSEIFCFIKFDPNDDYTVFQDYRIIKSFIKHRMWFELQSEEELQPLIFSPDFVIESLFNYIIKNGFHFKEIDDFINFLYKFRHRFTHSFKQLLEFLMLRNNKLDESNIYTLSLLLDKNFFPIIKYDDTGIRVIVEKSFQHARRLFNDDELKRYYIFHRPSSFESQEMFDFLITIHAVSYRIISSMMRTSIYDIDWNNIVISEQQAINMFLRHFPSDSLDKNDFIKHILKFEKEKWHNFRSLTTEEIFEI